MSGGEEKPAGPVIRYAPLGELRVYAVYEHELEILAHGSPASLYLNFALALLSVFATSLVALVTTPIPRDICTRRFSSYAQSRLSLAEFFSFFGRGSISARRR